MPQILPNGAEFLVNTTTLNNQFGAVTTQLAGGKFITVWTDNVLTGPFNSASYASAEIRAQIFNADGSKSGSEFLVNTTTAGGQLLPVVTQLTDGNILIAWQDGLGSLSSPASTPAAAIRAQEFSATGAAVGSEFQIGAGAEAFLPVVTPLAGGGFAAVWQQGRSGNVVGQVFDSANAAVGGQLVIDNSVPVQVAQPRLATLNDGNFVVVWGDTAGAPSSLRVFSATGATVTNTTPVFLTNVQSVIALANGGFAMAASTVSSGPPSTSIDLAGYLANGTFVGQERIVSFPTATGTGFRLAPLPNGGVAIAYADTSTPPDGSNPEVRVQAFNPIFQPYGDAFIVNTTTAGIQSVASIAALSTGNLVVTWLDNSGIGSDASGFGVKSALVTFDATNRAMTAFPDFFVLPSTSNTLTSDDFTDNDTDPDNDPLVVQSVANVAGGTVVLNQDATLTITPTGAGNAPVTFSYTATDGAGSTSTTTATVGFMTDDSLTVRGGTPVRIDVLANDRLPSLATTTLSAIGNGAFTTVIADGRPQLLYFPDPFYFNLLVGQTQNTGATYLVQNPSVYEGQYGANLTITLQGWAQLGAAGADTLTGTALADHLSGGTGAANTLTGLAGDDFYTVAVAGDVIVEAPNEGFDVVRSRLTTYTLPANVEGLAFSSLQDQGFAFAPTDNLVGTGNALDNRLETNAFVASVTLDGLDGNDTLVGSRIGTGTVTLRGGIGNDTYIVRTTGITLVENTGEGTDTVETALTSFTLGANIENLTLTGTLGSLGTGNELNNVIRGTAVGNQLTGGLGADQLIGGAGIDTVSYADNWGAVFVNLSTGQGFGNAAQGDTYTSIESVTGSLFNDFIIGSDASNTFIGGLGADTFLGFGGSDTANYQDNWGAVFVNLSTGQGFGNAAQGDSYDSIENAVGSSFSDFLIGTTDANRLSGRQGADTLIGAGGVDTFSFTTALDGTTDTIVDFGADDRLELVSQFFGNIARGALATGAFAIGPAALEADDRFLYDPATGALRFDSDGSGAGASVLFAQLSTGLTLDATNFIIV